MDEILSGLHTGIVKDDPIGYARGQAVRDLILKTSNKEEEPFVYFDKMRKYPAYSRRVLELMNALEISDEDMVEFDPDFYDYFIERLSAAVNVLNTREALDKNPLWKKYTADWDDYQDWLDKRRASQI